MEHTRVAVDVVVGFLFSLLLYDGTFGIFLFLFFFTISYISLAAMVNYYTRLVPKSLYFDRTGYA